MSTTVEHGSRILLCVWLFHYVFLLDKSKRSNLRIAKFGTRKKLRHKKPVFANSPHLLPLDLEVNFLHYFHFMFHSILLISLLQVVCLFFFVLFICVFWRSKIIIIITSCRREAATICPAPMTLTFDILTLKVVSESRVMCATSVPISVFLGLFILDLGPMYAQSLF